VTTVTSYDWAVEARGLVKRFGAHRAVDGIDLRVATGTVYGVLGPNGAGKSTTLRMLSTLLRPDAGTVRVFGHDVRTDGHRVRQLIGVTGQDATVDERLTATQNLELFARLSGLPGGRARRRAAELLEEFALTEAASRPLRQFSGGMRRRLDLAASLIVRPPLLFLDEPTTGLDPRTRAQMWDTVRRLVEEGSTVVLTTQYLEEADHLAGRLAVIDHGRVVAEGTVAELKSALGAATLQLRLDTATDLPRAVQVLGAVLPGRIEAEADRITAPLARPDVLTDVLLALRSAGVAYREVTIGQPTLDEVFLALTGHPTAPDDGSAAA
jgi:ABC-2 type transport system ATP-binding protein